MITNRIMNHECSFMSQIVNKLLIYKLVKSIHNLTLPTPSHSQSLQEPWLCSWRGVLLLTLPGTLSSWHDVSHSTTVQPDGTMSCAVDRKTESSREGLHYTTLREQSM